MKTNLRKHILVRLTISIILLLLLHFSQIEYSLNANLIAMGFQDNPTLFFGAVILFAWIIYLIADMARCFKNKLKWHAISNIVLIILIFLGYGFINILIALTRC